MMKVELHQQPYFKAHMNWTKQEMWNLSHVRSQSHNFLYTLVWVHHFTLSCSPRAGLWYHCWVSEGCQGDRSHRG